jgi:hypothetical protein
MGLFSRTKKQPSLPFFPDPRASLSDQVIAVADHGLTIRNPTIEAWVQQVGLDDPSSRWEASLSEDRFVWHGSRGQVVASVQVLGSRNAGDDSWLWGWANESVPAERRVAADQVRQFGVAQNCGPLTTGKVYCGPDQAWAFCNVAIGLGLGPFVYKGTNGPLEMYLLLVNPRVELAGAAPPPPAPPDFSDVDSDDKVQALVAQGVLAPVYLLAPRFGGGDAAANIVYAPPAIAALRERVDDMAEQMIRDGRRVGLSCQPSYKGASRVPADLALAITENNQAVFSQTIHVW